MYRKILITLSATTLLASCVSQSPAPVIDKSQKSEYAYQHSIYRVCEPRTPHEFCHIVQRGDTLYSISRFHGLKVVEVASRNNIQAPFIIRPGDQLVVRKGTPPQVQPVIQPQRATPVVQTRPAARPVQRPPAVTRQPVVRQPATTRPSPQTAAPKQRPQVMQTPAPTAKAVAVAETPKAPTRPVVPKVASAKRSTTPAKPGWQWPVPFTPLKSSDTNALDYELAEGTEVVAAASGNVIYAGAGLNKYKHLIIVDTGKSHLVAYEFNTSHNIDEGDSIQRGDRITRIAKPKSGVTGDAQRFQLFHFEIWADGKPLNPKSVIGASQRR